jgi:hypothetical protein
MALVLDTNVIRDIGAGDVDSAGLYETAREGVTVHLADGTVSELTHQLLTRSLKWDHWVHARTVLLGTLSKDEPVLPGGRVGLSRIGINGSQAVSQREIDEAVEQYDAAWAILVAANRPEDFEKFSVWLPRQGISVSLPQHHVQRTYAEERETWPTDFANFYEKILSVRPDFADLLPAKHDSREALEAYVTVIKESTDRGHLSAGPPPSFRLDAFLRVEALLSLRHLRREQRYNPKKNWNDLVDLELLKYLAVPAAICTGDAGLIAKVRDSHSWQARWVLRPADLAQATVRAEIKNLKWPEDAHKAVAADEPAAGTSV